MPEQKKSLDQLIDRRRNWEARVEMELLKLPKEQLTTHDKLVYVVLCGHAGRNGGAFPNAATLAEEASCSTRQVFRALSVLEKRGLVVRSTQILPGRGQICNLYEIHGFENYNCTPANAAVSDRCDCESQGGGVTDSHTPHDSQSHPYIRSIEQLQSNREDYSPSGRTTTAAAKPVQAVLPLEEPQEQTEFRQAETESGNPHPPDLSSDLDGTLPLTAVPSAMRQAAKYLLLSTGRKGLLEEELPALRALDARAFPAVVQTQIDVAVERFPRLGRDLRTLTFVYILECLRDRKPTRDRTTAGRANSRQPNDRNPQRPDLDAWAEESQRMLRERFSAEDG